MATPTLDLPEMNEAVLKDMAQSGTSSELGMFLRRHWDDVKAQLFEAGRDGGIVSVKLSQTMDQIIRALADARCDAQTCLVATGGYGRGRLAPYSDIDLLILQKGEDQEARLSPFIYTLWDGGFPLSHSTHTPQSAVKSAADDTVTRTAFLDARRIWGNKELFDQFQSGFDRLRRRTLAAFVEAKLKERDDRHDRTDASRYAIEPDVKEGKGALRDLDTLHWLDRYVSGASQDPFSPVADTELFTAAEHRRIEKILNFFWSVRVHLHDIAGRADERLHFKIQPLIAERLGYRSRRRAKAVERFMRHYFLNAQDVGRLTGHACAELEERTLKETSLAERVSSAVDRMVQEHPFDGEKALVRRGGRVTFFDHEKSVSTPRHIMVLFRAAGRHQIPIHPDALKTASRAARRVGMRQFKNPELAEIFRVILRDSVQPDSILRAMTETGVLGRALPAYGAIVGKVEYGLFRRFTLEEHILRSIGVLSDMLHDKDDGRFVLTKPFARSFDDPVPLYTSLLLQETAAGMTRPTPSRVRRRVEAQARWLLGKDENKVDLVQYAVMNRDLLFRTTSRRNVTDINLIQKISQDIQTEERLKCLAVINSCRHRTSGVRSWEEYAKRDVRLLIETIRAYLSGGEEGVDAYLLERREQLRSRARGMMPKGDTAAFDRFIERTGPTFWSMADVSAAADLAQLVEEVDRSGRVGGAMVRPHPTGMLQVIVYTEDKAQVFANCAGIVAEIGGTVWGASGFPLELSSEMTAGRRKGALIFQINRAGPPPQPFDASSDELSRIQSRFDEVACFKGDAPKVPAPVIGDRRAVFDVKPSIRVDETMSTEALIVEVEALDRPALLYHLASGLASISVTIQLAFVATYGHRAVDTFYLQDAPGYKITDMRRIETIRRQIIRVLEEA